MHKKHIIVWIVSFVLVLSTFGRLQNADANTNQVVSSWIQSMQHWYSVGYDYEEKKLDENRIFPWQKYKSIPWGNDIFQMTDTLSGETTKPVMYTEFYLNLYPESGKTIGSGKYYVVLDDHNNIWLDPDGKFQNCIYNPQNDPNNPSFVEGSCNNANILDGRIRYSVDTDAGNNTLGPYPIANIINSENNIIQIEEREFLVSLLDRIDYQIGSLVLKKDWDFELSLIRFNQNEKHTENVEIDSKYNPFETIYRIVNPLANEVQFGDTRLSPVFFQDQKIQYEVLSIVQFGDLDVGKDLIPFTINEMHSDQVIVDGKYSVGKKYEYELFKEFIYDVSDSSKEKVLENSVRLLPVDIKIDKNDYSLINWGIHTNDAFCLFEIPSTGERNDIGFETNIITSTKDYFSIRLVSPNSDVPNSFVSLSQGVLVSGDSYIFSQFVNQVKPEYAGYLGIEWFYDNGINNKLALENSKIKAYDLFDNFKENGFSEEILGMSDRTSDIDFKTSLFPIENTILFHDTSGNGFGVGDPIYRDTDENDIVSQGDERIIDVKVLNGLNEIEYIAGSIVTTGDADYGFILDSIGSDYLWTDRFSNDESNNLNGTIDVGEPIYKKQSIVQRMFFVQAQDTRITPVSIFGKIYLEGTIVETTSYFYRFSHFYGLSMWRNGNFRYLDLPVQPGKQDIRTELSNTLKVEQTTEIKVDLLPGKEKRTTYVFIEEPSLISSRYPMPMIKQRINKDQKTIKEAYTITPYTSSFTKKGWEYPLSLLVFVDSQGVDYKRFDFIDHVYNSYFYESKIDNRQKRFESLLPDNFSTDYYTQLSFNVFPEDASIVPSKKCVSTFDLRFPNLWAHLNDADNPLDVNDPYPIISSRNNEQIIGNYNATGAGIDYFFTAYATSNTRIDRYIVQVNRDRSYCFWFWQDVEPKGILNFADKLSPTPMFIYEEPSFFNADCSEGFNLYPSDDIDFNRITFNDEIGIFDGGMHELEINGVQFIIKNARVEKFGVDILFETYGDLNQGDPGGDYPIALLPIFGGDEFKLRTYAKNALYDYNNSLDHPPVFKQIESGQIQYLGWKTLKSPVVEDVNFTNLAIVDHGLQYSSVDYTAGDHPLYPMDDPVIVSPYNPLVQNWNLDFIAYPAGQTHIGRTRYMRKYRRGSGAFGFSSTPTISKAIYEDSPFRKLGTEQYPMTDYDIIFTLQNKAGEFIAFGEDMPSNRRIDKIIVEGPFKCPQVLDRDDGSVIPSSRIPLLFNETGKLVIDRSIAKWYQSSGKNWSGSIGFGANEIVFEEEDWNPLLVRTGILDYRGIPAVINIPELTLLRSGNLHVKIILADGTEIELGDCCSEKPVVGIPVHGLDFENVPDSLEVFSDHVLKPTLYEDEPYQESKYCNNAYVILWQDRGIRYYTSMALDPYEIGAGDGRINFGGNAWLDLNEDEKVSFADWETEIIGTYYLDTNTWSGGVFDGRTYNVNNGVYPLELTEATGTQITQYGTDFCSRVGDRFSRRMDHVISTEEVTPIYLSAYKFYDDNGDRAFTPKYHWRSHEVYLAGEKNIKIKAHEDLIVGTYPSPLTAGCISELVDPGNPLSFVVQDSTGMYLDFTFGVMDPNGRSNVDENDVWQHLFVDTPKEPLPQYYWTRTDLHNMDLKDDCNVKMYSKPNNRFSPIGIDFDESRVGKYKFKNFLANDEGAFEVVVYSPDHLHMGRTFVKVASPSIEYNIMPLFMDRKGQVRGAIEIGDPDFLMTAGTNKIYLLGVQAFNAQGKLIKGVNRGNPFRSEDAGETLVHSGRMTPYTTKPASFDLSENFDYVPDGYFLHMSIMDDLGKIEINPSNTFQMAGFHNEYDVDAEEVFYNTTNTMYDSGLFSKSGRILPNPTMIENDGWGYGCIYNYAHDGVYMFTDFDKDGMLTKEDSFDIDKNGEVYFFVYAEDVCDIGVLVNCNDYSDSLIFNDVVGKPPTFSDDPTSILGRFRKTWDSANGYSLADGIFKLDWDALPDRNIAIGPPKVAIRDSETQLPLRRDLLCPGNYDLVYGMTNAFYIYITPADSRDMAIEGGWVHLQGNQHESSIYGGVESVDRFNRRASISFTPTGIGEDTASLLYSSDNYLVKNYPETFNFPIKYVVDLKTHFDVLKAIEIKLPVENYLIQDHDNDIKIILLEKGTKAPIEGVTVSMSGEGFSMTKVSNEKGEIVFHVKPPEQKREVRIYALKEKYFEAETFIPVVKP
ncbi:MAG: hypothetical protein KAH01_05125 [Caldisericia bacterium]|nr:hypothetical protein [Caldisericia bacterium]